MPEFSFIIPVYNGEPHLVECLESLLSQGFKDIELICVDDGSTDSSLEVLNSYAQRDNRVHVLEQPENRGSARARRRGVLASKGTYVLFSDQDDSYEQNACEALHRQLLKSPVDVLQYGTRVVNEGGVEQGEIDGLNAWLTPYLDCLVGRAILDECFVNLVFAYSIWNKAYEGTLARRAFAALEDVDVPLGEDNYESFALLYYAKTYYGVPGKLYNYHYGRGYTGQKQQTAISFRRTCGLSVAADLMHSFLISQGSFEEYRNTYDAARKHLLRYTFDRWAVEVLIADKTNALLYVLDLWPYAEVLEYVVAERPRDVAALLDARFGPLDSPHSSGSAGGELDIYRRELAALSEACFEKGARIAARRQAYETSCAYKIGRCLTAPLRFFKKD